MKHREDPPNPAGFTQLIASNRGHLLDGQPRSKKNPWGDFVGTWDLPTKIPGNTARVPTARADHALDKLQEDSEGAGLVLTGKMKNDTRSSGKA